MEKVLIEVIEGRAGQCLAIDGIRVAGPKSWAGGIVIQKWKAGRGRIRRAIGDNSAQLNAERWTPVEEGLPECTECDGKISRDVWVYVDYEDEAYKAYYSDIGWIIYHYDSDVSITSYQKAITHYREITLPKE